MKTAIVYDRVNKWGGAERVLLSLHEIFPDAPLYTSVYDPDKAKWADVFPKVIPSFLQKIPKSRSNHEYLATAMPFAFESFNFDSFDLVISITSEAAKGVITSSRTKHICYCLTPTRYLWSGYKEYFRNDIIKYLAQPALFYLRKWDRIAARRPDQMVAISTSVQKRIKKYYNRKSSIIFPPVETDIFRKKTKTKKENYFLVVSRLVQYKKVDLVIDAFNDLGLPLVVVGEGKEKKKLQRNARQNVIFKSGLSDLELASVYQKARGFIFPQHEDFGLVAVEALSAGTPVIAYNKGGSRDIITEGKTGIFFDTQNKQSIIKATNRFMKTKFDTEALVSSAKRFSKERFKKDFLSLV